MFFFERIDYIYPDFSVIDAILKIYDEELYFEANLDFIRRCIDTKIPAYYIDLCIQIIIRAEMEKNTRNENGNFVHYYQSGEKRCEGNFVNGFREGEHIFYYLNGQVREKIFFSENARSGQSISYDRYGDMKHITNYRNNLLHGTCTRFYKSGTVKFCAEYKYNEKDGTCREYFENGNIYIQSHYFENKLEGPFQKFYENGGIHERKSYMNGSLFGDMYIYSTRGNLLQKKHFSFGKLDRKQFWYFNSFSPTSTKQKLKKMCSYKKGKLNGVFQTFYIDGKMEYNCSYIDGKKHGTEKFISRAGYVTKKEKWKHGMKAEEYTKQKNEMNLRLFFETKNSELYKKLPKLFLIKKIEAENITSSKFNYRANRQKLLEILTTIREKKIETKTIPAEEKSPEYDLFGNEIKSPVIGNDGAIYDLESMKTLFTKKNNRYLHISYGYENEESVPNYPRMENGKILSEYYTVEELDIALKTEKNPTLQELQKTLLNFKII